MKDLHRGVWGARRGREGGVEVQGVNGEEDGEEGVDGDGEEGLMPAENKSRWQG